MADDGKKRGRHPINALTAIRVRNEKKPGRHADGNGLYLVVDPSGARRWLLRLVIEGNRRDLGLGSAVLVPLSEAREMALAYRKIARQGGNPVAARKEAPTAPTFSEAAETVHRARAPGFRNAKHSAQWLSTLKTYAYPTIGDISVNLIGTPDILRLIGPIWLAKPETARRVLQRIVEIACYTNFVVGMHGPPAIAFHVHVIVRNPNRYDLQARMDRINAKHRSLVPGCPAADMRPITPGDHHKVLKYLVKEPSAVYRAYPVRKETINWETGEVEKWMTGRFFQKKKQGSPGVQLRTREVVRDWHMDKMILAGGAGRETIAVVRKHAMRLMPYKVRGGRNKQFSGYFESRDDD